MIKVKEAKNIISNAIGQSTGFKPPISKIVIDEVTPTEVIAHIESIIYKFEYIQTTQVLNFVNYANDITPAYVEETDN